VAFTVRTQREGREENEDGKLTSLPGSLDATQKEVGKLGRQAFPIQLDLRDPASVDDATEQLEDAWGGIDLLVNKPGTRWGSTRTPTS
jgi:NADP-dependent 3-hydroxy acid dehydrogenase YdfG